MVRVNGTSLPSHTCSLKATAVAFDIKEEFTCMMGEKDNEYIKKVLFITVSYNLKLCPEIFEISFYLLI